MKATYLSRDCLAALYVEVLLVDGFGLDEGARVLPRRELADQPVSWVLGALLGAFDPVSTR